jgi:hypothetical protein
VFKFIIHRQLQVQPTESTTTTTTEPITAASIEVSAPPPVEKAKKRQSVSGMSTLGLGDEEVRDMEVEL